MKNSILFYASVIILGLLFGCQTSGWAQIKSQDSTSTMTFDSIRAKTLGADDYGMKRYIMAFLRTGPNRDQDSVRAARIMRQHLDNITRMADEGKLALAGPFLDNGDIRGIYIFNVTTIEEAKALTETDPAIKEGRLVMELHPWYGSAALMEVPQAHKRISKHKI